MTHRDFCYWLKGYDEISGASPTEEQWKVIQNHLKICFNCENIITVSTVADSWERLTTIGPSSSYLPNPLFCKSQYMPAISC